jgi:hypothetical protein
LSDCFSVPVSRRPPPFQPRLAKAKNTHPPFSNSNLNPSKRLPRPISRWKAISSGQLSLAERGILGSPPAPTQGPLNRCRCCLSLGHDSILCNGQPRCSVCFRYGHSTNLCKARANQLWIFRLVSYLECEAPASMDINPSASASNASSPPPPTLVPLPTTVTPPPSATPMANFAVDPVPFLPAGYVLERSQPYSLLRHEVYLTGCYNKTNEELANYQCPIQSSCF